MKCLVKVHKYKDKISSWVQSLSAFLNDIYQGVLAIVMFPKCSWYVKIDTAYNWLWHTLSKYLKNMLHLG